MASVPGTLSLIRSAIWRPSGSLYFVTMDEGPLDHLQQVEAACEAGIRWVQLRMKQADREQFLAIAAAAKKICDEWGSALIINDRVEIAVEVKAHGVHLGKEDMCPAEARRMLGGDFIIGATANTMEDIRKHDRDGVDYVGLGPYQYTTTKKDLSPILHLEGYRQIMGQLSREKINIPIIAIGGIGEEDAASLLHTGVQGIAFSGLLVHSADRKATVRQLKEEMQKIRHSGIV